MLLGGVAGILGSSTGGFYKTGPMLSKQYSHFVTGNISLGISITMLVIPFVVGVLTPDNTAAQWRLVFLTVAACLLAANLFYCIFVTGEPAEWTKMDFVESNRVAAVPATLAELVKELEKTPEGEVSEVSEASTKVRTTSESKL